MTAGNPLYLYAPYEDKPWFYVEPADPSQYPCALPYYRAAEIRGYMSTPEPHCKAHEDAGTEWPDMFTREQMIEFAKAYASQQEVDAARYRWLTETDNVSLLSYDVIIEGANFKNLTTAIDEELARSK